MPNALTQLRKSPGDSPSPIPFRVKLHATYSCAYALWGPLPVLLSYFKPFRSFQCLRVNQKKFNAGEGSQIAPSHFPRRQLASIAALLPDSGIRVREGGEATRYFCIVGTVIHWLLLFLLILTLIWSQSRRHMESWRLLLSFLALVCHIPGVPKTTQV